MSSDESRQYSAGYYGKSYTGNRGGSKSSQNWRQRGRGRGTRGRVFDRGRHSSSHHSDDVDDRRPSRGKIGHPQGLRGRQIGMYYAARGKAKRKELEMKSRKSIHMNESQISHANYALGQTYASSRPEKFEGAPSTSNFQEEKVEDIVTDSFSELQDLPDTIEDSWFSFKVESDKNQLQNEQLLEEFNKKMNSDLYNRMSQFRKKLPAYEKQDEIMEFINKEQVIVISGETGCGKTTQVPQFILDDSIRQGRGMSCKVVCTQPRRISAISVAERVAEERAEKCGQGQSCGYQIRLDSKLPRSNGSILYCTTGILLQQLKSDRLLTQLSHLVLDEIHERDLHTDFLLTIIKSILEERQDLKIILMSATLNAELFSAYFHNCPTFHIPGFTYPVESIFLEEILDVTKYSPPEAAWRFADDVKSFCNGDMRRRQASKIMSKNIKPDFVKEWNMYRTGQLPLSSGVDVDISKKAFAMHAYTQSNVDAQLIIATIKYIVREQPKGAILVFVPGWTDIKAVNELLVHDVEFSSSRYLIIPLHSLMPTTHQRQVFERPQNGITKIVIATNIAETSITIDDVVHVVDSGKIKISNFDHSTNMGLLQMEWISRANAKQRKGRAGRVQEGFCYHLYTKLQESKFKDFLLPEMLRTTLDQLCLQIRVLKLGMIEDFLSRVLETPDPKAIQLSIKKLIGLSAMDAGQNLTPLGYHLARLPVEPQIGKMILMGAIFSCLDPILTIAANLSFKDPFVVPLGKEKDADRQRKILADGYNSDHIMLLNTFQGWEEAKRLGYRAEGDYCWDNFLAKSTLTMLQEMKGQFAKHLQSIGFAPSSSPKDPVMNKSSKSMKVVLAVVCSGLYPNICKLKTAVNPKAPAKLETATERRLEFHPKSVNYGASSERFSEQWLCYYLKMKTSAIFLFDTSEITAYPLLFFGGDISSYYDQDMKDDVIAVDKWIVFRSKPHIAKLVKELRQALDKILERKIRDPDVTILTSDTVSGEVLSSIVDLITTE